MEKKYTFELTEQQANIVLQGLGELPAKASIGVIGSLRQQFQQQAPVKPPAKQTSVGKKSNSKK